MITSGNMLSFKNLILNSPGIVQIVMQNVTLPGYSKVWGGFSIKSERNSYGMDYVLKPFTVRT